MNRIRQGQVFVKFCFWWWRRAQSLGGRGSFLLQSNLFIRLYKW